MDYITTHQAESWFLLGCLLLVLDMTVFGFSSGVFLFVGIGGLITGLLMLVGILPETQMVGIASIGLLSVAAAVLLWKPLKKMQKKGVVKPENTSDFIGYEFILADDISPQQNSRIRYSGVDWRVELAAGSEQAAIKKGTRVKVMSIDSGIFRVGLAALD
ncbi:MAG: NfeD family protein [gamma proteobacterium symbiont of Bathyaustriella thionipta]|nr:NfeD family protein [gamma proteobacterium symbiont of Bathyaustriella thionipta]